MDSVATRRLPEADEPTPPDAQDLIAGRAPRVAGRVPAWWLIVALLLLATPLVVALVVQHDPRWYPSGDAAQIELRVRDVFSADPPLIGLGGRIGGPGIAQGSHPGPLAFYLMAPVHRALGDTAWALQAATAAVHIAALGTTLWLVRRRGGPALFLGTATVLGVVVAALTAELLTLPWNPYLPLLWLLAFLVAVWSVTCDDLAALPVAAFAGTVCAQTHVPYSGVVAVGAVVVLGWLALRLWRPPAGGPTRSRVVTATAIAGAVSVVLWLPPVLEQLFEDSGNLARVVDYFADPPGDLLGLGDGVHILLARLDPWRLLTDRAPGPPFAPGGSTVPGTLLLAAWVVAVVVAWRLHARALLRLHGVVAAALVATALSLSRILGAPFGYLSLWCLCIGGLVVLAVGWTIGLLIDRWASEAVRDRLRPASAVVLALAFVGVATTAAVGGASAEPTELTMSRILGSVVPETVAALQAGRAPGTGEDGRYLVTSSDPVHLGFPMHGLIDELERAGLDVGSDSSSRVALTPHRVLDAQEATAEVHLAVGPAVDVAAAHPGAVEVARGDLRDRRERARYEEVRDDAVRRLEAAGAGDLADRVDEVSLIAGDPRVDFAVRDLLGQLRGIGVPAAVFVGPPGFTDS